MASNVQQKSIRHRWQNKKKQQQQHEQQQQKVEQQRRRGGGGGCCRQRSQQHFRLNAAAAAALATVVATRKTTSTVALWLSLLLLLLLSHENVLVNAEGNVGCHFVKTLCLDGSEVCFNDNIFGKCIPTTGVDVADIEKTPLTEDQSRILATMLEEMQGAGLGWDHPFVQCRIQGTLYSLQKHTQLPPNLCANLAPNPEIIDPASAMAFVRFTPPNEDYADELFYPPLKKHTTGNNGIGSIFRQLQQQDRQLRHDPSELEHLDRHHPAVESPTVLDAYLERERERIQAEQQQREAELEAERKHALRNRLQLYQMLSGSEPDPEPYQRHTPPVEAAVEEVPPPPQLVQPAYVAPYPEDSSNEMYFPENFASFKRTGGNARHLANQRLNADAAEIGRVGTYFRELANEQEHLRPETTANRDFYSHTKVARPLEAAAFLPTYKRLQTNIDEETNDFEQEEEEQAEDEEQAFDTRLLHNSLTPFEEEAILAANAYPTKHKYKKQQDGVYTEGGLVYIPERDRQEELLNDEKKEKARILLANMLGFTRHERLDVKKPGPLIGPPPAENLANDNRTKAQAEAAAKGNKYSAKTSTPVVTTKEVLPEHIKDSSQGSKKKKVALKDHSDEDHAPHTVDTEYAHVFVKNPIDSWTDGVRIMNELANILHMQGYFYYLTVQSHEVSFRVDSNNPEHKTASDIAKIINENRAVKNNIQRRLGVTVLNAGVGDKIKSDQDGGVSASRIELSEQGPDVTHIMAYMFAGAGAAAVIVIFVTLILIKRHDKKRDKLGGLQSGISGAESFNKDYQDLCRARMAGKGNTAEPQVASGRITSLSKETDRPPSSRSSTSSWSEEPALTNMDISTGHMVLSYMEDHLRNKGRLQREWEALCRYEAEPSARDAALQPQCATLNRPGAPLPYDHSRVVLNHLANAEGLDYVNASTITDHDPRAPAYVAAQGPLPTTLAHFWQMIWEQGAVVIVALCRLQENGEIACARYWPEEGAEVYHIYEVHLVSEHIWCDDYLVRSFYLKNLRTSETRTVTQFHFLSWPQGGVPAQPKALLDFRRKVNKSYRGRSCPIVVHGSAGAGRTGAYILLDLVLGRMNKGAREIDIAATLEHLRDQRAGLVATRQQFEFVLMAVAEEVHAILKALPANQTNEKREVGEGANGADKKDTTAVAAATTTTLKEEQEHAEATEEAAPAEATTSKKAQEAQEAQAKDAAAAGENNNKSKAKATEKTTEATAPAAVKPKDAKAATGTGASKKK